MVGLGINVGRREIIFVSLVIRQAKFTPLIRRQDHINNQ
jgi:hypothetical protein|tara:strand:- start:130 stop:246 length:117 start_codon:yes stop_codon:yes gene_type:complete